MLTHHRWTIEMGKALDLSGLRFGRLLVQGRHPNNSPRGASMWTCLCDCGEMTITVGSKLTEQRVQSCGCLVKDTAQELAKSLNLTHGHSRTPEYVAWINMKSRCSNPRTMGYEGYGGRGISVDPRWENSFENFLADMGQRPSPDHSLDRREVDGNYGPGNCRWATFDEQQNNKRNSVLFEYQGKSYTRTQLCRLTGVDVKTFQYRINCGKSIEEALRC